MTAKQVLNVAYASLTEGLDGDGRADVDSILNGETPAREKPAARNQDALQQLRGLGITIGKGA